MLRILVTGSSGRLGRAISARLARRHQVVGLDLAPGPRTSLVGGLGDATLLRQACRGVQAVIHTAALHAPDVGRRSAAEFRQVNVDGTRRLLDACLQAGVRRLVYTGSTSTYGRALESGETAVWVTEALQPDPRDIYDETKLAAEAACAEACGAGFVATGLRVARCFREGAETVAIHRLFRGVARADVAQAHELALLAPATGWRVYNVAARSPFMEGDLALLRADAAAVIARRLPWAPAEFARRGWRLPRSIDRVYVAERARAELGYRPAHDFAALLGRRGNGGKPAGSTTEK